MVWLNLTPIPVGKRGVFSSFKWILPVFATRRGGGEGVGALWELPRLEEIESWAGQKRRYPLQPRSDMAADGVNGTIMKSHVLRHLTDPEGTKTTSQLWPTIRRLQGTLQSFWHSKYYTKHCEYILAKWYAVNTWPSLIQTPINLKEPKWEIFDRSDFHDFYTIKSLWGFKLWV